MQQPKNLLLFIVLSMIVVFGWSALQNHFWPPPKKKKPVPVEEQVQDVVKIERSEFSLVAPTTDKGWAATEWWWQAQVGAAAAQQIPTAPGVANACALVGQLAAIDGSGKVSR